VFWVLPFVEGVNRDDHAAALERIAKARQRLYGLCARVEEAVAERLIFRPVWDEPPARVGEESFVHHGAVRLFHFGVRCNECRGCGGRHVPVRLPRAAHHRVNRRAELARDLLWAAALHDASTHAQRIALRKGLLSGS